MLYDGLHFMQALDKLISEARYNPCDEIENEKFHDRRKFYKNGETII
ncbi:hypothetical protein AN619_13540 [Thermotalea metallivorans]|uniref:Uncharacterized protein n=1 Tax=Thermotalea metallivorans TaxID=520762 RepID=A0A140L5R6_9FIRM|nr:hypothetical protein AN619_13540 [Thermotalea metallivorans]